MIIGDSQTLTGSKEFPSSEDSNEYFLMQEHLDLASNVMEWSHVVANTSLEEDLGVNFVLI